MIYNSNITIHGVKHKSMKFPGGEINVQLGEVTQHAMDRGAYITAHLNSSDDIMELLLICDAMKRYDVELNCIHIPYFPYARQDRVCNSGEAFSLAVMCNLINSIGAQHIIVEDPHSDVTPALIHNCVVTHQSYYSSLLIDDNTIVVCPDAGAEKKILALKHPYIMATKVRDVATGNITATKLYIDKPLDDTKRYLIVDDICDGGRTFIELAKVLREKGASIVDLYVTHGIFSKGIEVFTGLINNVYYIENGEIICEKTL